MRIITKDKFQMRLLANRSVETWTYKEHYMKGLYMVYINETDKYILVEPIVKLEDNMFVTYIRYLKCSEGLDDIAEFIFG